MGFYHGWMHLMGECNVSPRQMEHVILTREQTRVSFSTWKNAIQQLAQNTDLSGSEDIPTQCHYDATSESYGVKNKRTS
jgi:hypothetical protein